MKARVNYSREDHLLNITLVLFFILPQNMVMYLFVPLSMLLLTNWNKGTDRNLSRIIYILVGVLGFSLLINIASPWFNQKSVLKTIQMTLLLLCFGRIKSYNIIGGYLVFLLFYLALFQFAYQFRIPGVVDFMNVIYPLTEEEMAQYSYRQEMSFSDIGGYMSRLGGIYFNSNNCAFFLECLLLLFINEKDKFKKVPFVIYITLLTICIISTGSRTSFLVLILIALTNFRGAGLKSVLGIAFIVFAFLLFYYNGGSSFRLFQVNQGLNDSFGIKVDILLRYLDNQDSALRLLFGSFSTACIPEMFRNTTFAGTDFDIGDFIVAHGFVGFICLVSFVIAVFIRLSNKHRCFFCILLWCLSNTVFMSYRGSSVIMIILSIYYLQVYKQRRFISSTKQVELSY